MATRPDSDLQRDNGLDLSYTDEEAARIEENPILITLSGHTCSGKTEWLSSLFRAKVGETSPEPDTTQEKWFKEYSLPGRNPHRPYIKIADVPGQQFSSEILHRAKEELGQRPKPRQMDEFIMRNRDVGGDHQSDIRLLEHFRSCDVILYLADCQDAPVVALEDEFELVKRLGRPVIAVLNFSARHAQPSQGIINQWRETFEIEGAKEIIELDAFDKNPADLRRLGVLLENQFREQPIKAKFMRKYWEEQVIATEEQRISEAVNTLADFLVDAATYTIKESMGKGNYQESNERKVKRKFQKDAVAKIANLPKAIMDSYPEFTEMLDSGSGQKDTDSEIRRHDGPFGGKIAKRIPTSTGRGAVVGGLIGLTGDAMIGGVSGGSVMLMGSVIGAAIDVGLFLKVRKTSLVNWGSYIEVQLSERTLKTCCMEGLALIDALRRRGLGSTEELDTTASRKSLPGPDKVLGMLKEKRDNASWSGWADAGKSDSRRQTFVNDLALELRQILENAGKPSESQTGGLARTGKAAVVALSSVTSRMKGMRR